MPFATVIGGANMDIGGWPEGTPRMGDSNPGVVRISPGGVGRNIAHNLALLGVETRLITAYGRDDYARIIRNTCRRLGIDDSASAVFPHCRTSSYLFLTDGQGEMALAVSDMEIYRHLTPAVLSPHLAQINDSAAVVLDANLPQETISYLARHCTAPLFADPVSVAKCGAFLPVLDKLHTLKPNRLEAQALSGVTIRDETTLRSAAAALLERGVGRVLLSLGREGILAAEPGRMLHLPAIPTVVVNATGAGDAMMAAAVGAFLARRSLADTAREALSAASLTLGCERTVYPDMSREAILKKLG